MQSSSNERQLKLKIDVNIIDLGQVVIESIVFNIKKRKGKMFRDCMSKDLMIHHANQPS